MELTPQELESLYKEFVRFYDSRHKDFLNYTTQAENSFTGVLKLLITLSTAMIAFLSAAKGTVFVRIEQSIILIPLESLVLTALFAIISLSLIALHQKRYADQARFDTVNMYILWESKKFEEVKKRIENSHKEFKDKKCGDWQHSTIGTGIGAIICFFFSIIFIIYFLFIK